MSDLSAADLRLGGRLAVAASAIIAGKLNLASGVFREIAEELSVEALNAPGGLLAPEDGQPAPEDWSVTAEAPAEAPVRPPSDLQSCARGAHAYGLPAEGTGWRVCGLCGYTNVTNG